MGLLDRLFGKPEPPITDPARLWDELSAAALADDARHLERLARANAEAILTHFSSWQKVPREILENPSAAQEYVHSLVTIAELFAGRLGRPELMAALTLAAGLLARRPNLPVAHLHLGKSLAALGRIADARAALEAGLAARPDPDVRTRVLLELSVLAGDPAKRAALLQEAVAVNGNLVAAASAALVLQNW